MRKELIGTEQRPLLLSNKLIKEMQYSFGPTITLQLQETYEAPLMREHALQDGFCFKMVIEFVEYWIIILIFILLFLFIYSWSLKKNTIESNTKPVSCCIYFDLWHFCDDIVLSQLTFSYRMINPMVLFVFIIKWYNTKFYIYCVFSYISFETRLWFIAL